MIPEHWPIFTNWFWLMHKTTPLDYTVYLIRKRVEEDEPSKPERLEE